MIDNMNPTSQFHPYQPERSEPQTGKVGGLGGILSKLGIDQSALSNIDFRGGLDKARNAARSNPKWVLGGLAALAIGAGLMRKRAMSSR
jgi:hypothetical protein